MTRRTKIAILAIVVVVMCLLDAAGVTISDPRFQSGLDDRAAAARVLDEASKVH